MQCEKMLRDQKSPADVYGAEHLLRLFSASRTLVLLLEDYYYCNIVGAYCQSIKVHSK